MLDYTFQTLSPIEFEVLCRDLLQRELNVTLQSFTSGRDRGVDLRHSSQEGTFDLIVQCKRHISTFAKLKSNLLKSELPKVKQLDPLPRRYLIMTSVGLTDQNKEEIMKLFHPFILNASDIFGRDDINNLLTRFPEIEQQHYKLWLSSTNVMDTILHSDVVNKTLFEKDEIIQTVTTYVENESYAESLKKFKRKRFVIIAGDAGIGKTTLARMLIYRMLANKEYTQFVYVSRGIEEALKLYKPSKNQLFFFDDFLGKTAFEKGFARNEETELVRFIKRIMASKNKGLILATREYILRQAQTQYNELESPIFNQNKYTINLGTYTKKIRANILYNHLFRTSLPQQYLAEFLDQKAYKEIVTHPNYTPRLIETILQEDVWNETTPKKFPSLFLKFLTSPGKIWKDIYENGLSSNARMVMRILLTLRTPVKLSKLHSAFESCIRQSGYRPDYHLFESAIKELSDTFLRASTSPYSEPDLVVDYKNPSILDFMIGYYNTENKNDLRTIIDSAVFIDQLVSRFCLPDSNNTNAKICLNQYLIEAIKRSILSGFDKLPSSQDRGRIISSYSSTYFNRGDVYSKVLSYFLFDLKFQDDTKIVSYLLGAFVKHNSDPSSTAEFRSQQLLTEYFFGRLSESELEDSIDKLARSIENMEDLNDFYYLKSLSDFEDQVEDWINNNSLLNETTDAILAELEEIEPHNLDEYENRIDEYEQDFEFNRQDVQARYEELLSESATEDYDDIDFKNYNPSHSDKISSDQEDIFIEEMFESLR